MGTIPLASGISNKDDESYIISIALLLLYSTAVVAGRLEHAHRAVKAHKAEAMASLTLAHAPTRRTKAGACRIDSCTHLEAEDLLEADGSQGSEKERRYVSIQHHNGPTPSTEDSRPATC